MIQEWWGLNENMKKLATEYSQNGFICVVPDLYKGKIATSDNEASHLMDGLNWSQAVQEIGEAVSYLKQKHGLEYVAVMGFCMGGALSIASASLLSGIWKVVCFYGIPPKELADPKNIKCPIQLHFGQKDTFKGFSDPEAAADLVQEIESAGIKYEYFSYPDADHAFMNSVNSKSQIFN